MDSITLTRRDALEALAGGGLAAGGALAVSERAVDTEPPASSTDLSAVEVATAAAVAEVVYPSAVDVTTAFVERYLRGLDAERTAALIETVEDLNRHTRSRYGEAFHELDSRDKRDAVLRSLGVDRVRSVPTGTVPERVRYHLVNSLLYALFVTPKGGELVGISNPTGYPGGPIE